MTSKTFVSGTVIDSAWLNDVNDSVYSAEPAPAGSFREALATSVGSSLLGFIQAGVGAVLRSIQAKLRETVSVNDFGAVGDGVTDDTAVWNKTVLHLALRGGGKMITPSPSYYLAGKVLVPSNIEIDLLQTVINGSLTSTLFETGYLSAGALVTNIGTANETHTLYGARIHNGIIKDSLLGFNAFNFLAGCEFFDIQFYDCVQNAYAKRSFYNGWRNLYSANTVAGLRPGIPAYTFDDNNNAVHFDRVFTTGRDIAYLFKGAMFQGKISGLSAEGGTNGIVIENETFALDVSNNYFENLTGTAIDLTYTAVNLNTNIDCNLFHNVATAIAGTSLIGGKIGSGNTYSGVTTKVNIPLSASTSTIEVFVDGTSQAPPYSPALPAGYTLAPNIKVVGQNSVYNNSSGVPEIAAPMVNSDTLIALQYSGNSGMSTGFIPFCTHVSSSPGASPFNVLVSTKIAYNPYVMVIFKIVIGAAASHTFTGRIFGTTVFLDETGGGLTVTASDVGGFIQLQLNGLTNTGGAYSAEGIVRIV